MEKILDLTSKKKTKEVKKDPYTQHLQNAYDWYNQTRNKENKTPLELSYIIEIEERHKMEIIKQYHKSLENEK